MLHPRAMSSRRECKQHHESKQQQKSLPIRPLLQYLKLTQIGGGNKITYCLLAD